MGAQGPSVIDAAVQDMNLWLNELAERAGGIDRAAAYRLLRAVLHAVRDHLTPDEAAQLGAQLPVLVRGIYYEGWAPARTPVRERSREGFVARVQTAHAPVLIDDPEPAIRAVFALLDAHVSAGEMADVRGMFHARIRPLLG